MNHETPLSLDIEILPLPKRMEGRYLGVVFGVLVGVLGSYIARPKTLPGHITTLDGWIKSAGSDLNVLMFVLLCTAIASAVGFLIGYVIDIRNNRGINKLNRELQELEGKFRRLQRETPQPVAEMRAVLDHIAIVDHQYRKISGWAPLADYRAILFWAFLLPITQLLVWVMARLMMQGFENGMGPALSELRAAASQAIGLYVSCIASAIAGALLGWAYCALERRKGRFEKGFTTAAAVHYVLFLIGYLCVALSTFLACVIVGIVLGSPFAWIVIGGAMAAVAALVAKKQGLL